MRKSLSLLFLWAIALLAPSEALQAQKRYKHLRHARTPEGKVRFSPQTSAPKTLEIMPLTSTPNVTEVAFEMEQIPESAPEPSEMFTASADPQMESLPVVKEYPGVQRAKRILRKTEHTLRSLPFADKALAEVNFSALDPQKPQVDGKKFIIIGCIILGVAALLGILGIVLSVVVVLSGGFPWPLIFNYIGLLLFFGGAAFLVVGIIFRVREKRGS